jgi:gas vesicle protein GvpL/GvpF
MSEADLDRLIARWAEGRAGELIAEAQAEALEAARARLKARLTDALLEAAAARLTTPERHAPSPGGPLLWVYGIVPGSEPPPAVAGVDGSPVRAHPRAGVTALVSDVPAERFGEEALKARLEDLETLEVLARAHEGVLESAMAAGAVVPFRLCTIYASQGSLDEMLDREGPALTATLHRLEGMQEWGVKGFLRAPAVVGGDDDTPSSGLEYLSRKRERRDAAEAGRDETDAVVAEIHARLADRAGAATLSRPQDRRVSGRETEMVLNAAYLVPADATDAFRQIVEELGRRHEPDGVALELTGPWPPYHFATAPEK